MSLLARPRRTPTRGRTLDRLLAAVEQLLHDGESYADLTVAEITAHAGVARSTFYVHFADRRELLFRLVDRSSAPLLERLDGIQSDKRAPDGERLKQAIRQAVAFARENAAVYRALIEAASYDSHVAAYRRALTARFVAALEERLRTQQSQGRGSPLPARGAALALTSMVAESCLRQVSEETGVEDDELAQALATIWERGAYGTYRSARSARPSRS